MADLNLDPALESRAALPVPQVVSLPMGPAPLMRPALAGARPSGGRAPRLGLAIPAKSSPPTLGRPTLPTLQLPSVFKSSDQPCEELPKLATGFHSGQSAGAGSESSAAHSRSGSFGPTDSATSQFSYRSLDPSSAAGSIMSDCGDRSAGMERENSLQGLDSFDKLTLDRAREQDVEDLDEDGWKIVSLEKRVVELSNLGEGAGGAVTKCKLNGGTTNFALKIITSNPDPDVRKQILRELKFNQKCRDPHICRYYGAFEDPSTSTLSIAMEFCEGGSLDTIYKEVRRFGGRTSEKVLGKISEAVLRGLTYLHGERIIHRDVKPSNILLCRNGDVKLCDFGVSGIFGTKGEADTFIGTSYYMAPERITGQPYTITSDVWSTGVTLLEVAQHRFPFPADGTDAQPQAGLLDLLTYIVCQPIPRLKDEPDNNVSWSDSFKYFIECCLEKDPSRRGRPWKMLEHPWMLDMAAKRVNMRRYVAQVWGWDEEKSTAAPKPTPLPLS